MSDISYEVPLIQQGVQECLPASTTQLLNFHGIAISFEGVKQEVPLYISSDGKPIGTSTGHMGMYLLQQGFQVTFHTVDLEIFDRSWKDLSSDQLIEKLRERRKYIQHVRYDDAILDVIFDGYIRFLQKGGKVILPVIDEAYLLQQLANGPFIIQVSYNFLNDSPKYRYDMNGKKYVQDDVKGDVTTHAVVVSGYSHGKFTVVDPDFEFGGRREIPSGKLLGAFYLAETDLDPLLITVSK